MGTGSPQFRITSALDNGHTVVAVSGELDIGTCAELEDVLKATNGIPLVLDLERCTFIDSMGIGVIVRAGTRSDEAGHRLVLRNVRGQVEQMLHLTGLAGWHCLDLESSAGHGATRLMLDGKEAGQTDSGEL
jgi:anti-anti-sigma factor